MKYFHTVVALACALASAWADACSFGGLEHEVHFTSASTHLESPQVLSLTDWFIGKRDARGATGGIYRADIIAAAIKDDIASSTKARRRLAEIADLLKILSASGSIDVQTHIEEIESRSIRRPEHLDVLNATVQPACAKTGSCCSWSDGPAVPHKQ